MKPVKATSEVKVGDMVEHNDLDAYHPQRTLVEVVGVTATKLRVRFPDGSVKTCGLTRVVSTSTGRYMSRASRAVFQLLDGHDKWQRAEPKTNFVRIDTGSAIRSTLVVIDRTRLITNFDDVQRELAAIRDWFTSEPART